MVENSFALFYIKCSYQWETKMVLLPNMWSAIKIFFIIIDLCAGALKTNPWSEELYSLQTTIQAPQVLLSLFCPSYKSIKGIHGSRLDKVQNNISTMYTFQNSISAFLSDKTRLLQYYDQQNCLHYTETPSYFIVPILLK